MRGSISFGLLVPFIIGPVMSLDPRQFEEALTGVLNRLTTLGSPFAF